MKRLFSIEFLRVWFLILIIITHSSMADSFDGVFGENLLHTMGSRVDIFMLICGFFLFMSIKKRPESDFWTRCKHRLWRILPVILLYKLMYMLFIDLSVAPYILSDLFMLNRNVGINVPTITHIIWYVDVMFWVYLLYLGLFSLFERGKALFATTIVSLVSLMILFINSDVNLHFEMALSFIDGGLLRGIGFMGMGILLAALPYKQINLTRMQIGMITVAELICTIMAVCYPALTGRVNPGIVLNHVLWVVLFIFLMTREYGWLSKKLNSCSWIWFISRNCYEIYVFQLFAIILAQKWFSPNQHPFLTIVAMLIIALGIAKAVDKFYLEPLNRIKNKNRLK